MVVGHCGGSSWIVSFIYAFHMPAFFFITGFLTDFSKGRSLSFAVRKFINLLVPFFFLTFFLLSVKAILATIPGYQSPFGWQDVSYGDALRLLFTRGDVYSQPLGAFWFLPCIFFSLLILRLLVVACHGHRGLVFLFSSAVAILGFYLLSIDYQPFIWILRPKQVFIAQYMMCLGWLVRKSVLREKYLNLKHPVVCVTTFLISLGILLYLSLHDHYRLSVSRMIFPSPTWMFVISSLSGSMMVLSLSVLISAIPFGWIKAPFIYLGKGSLSVMIFHFLGIKLFGLFLVGVGYFQYTEIFSVIPPDTTLGILRVAYVVVSIAFSLGLYEGLKRIPVVGDLCGFRNKIANKAGGLCDAILDKIS